MTKAIPQTRLLRKSMVSLLLLLSLWARPSQAHTVDLTADQLAGFLDDLARSPDARARSLGADLRQRLADAGVTFTRSGLFVSGPIHRRTLDIDCASMVVGLPLKRVKISDGSWQANLDGESTRFGFTTGPGRLGLEATLAGRVRADADGQIYFGIGIPHFCASAGSEDLDVEASGRFRATLALTLDASLERGDDGGYFLVLGRRVVEEGLRPISGSIRTSIDYDIDTHTRLIGEYVEFLAKKVFRFDIDDVVKDAAKAEVDAKNGEILSRVVGDQMFLPIRYRLPGPEDPRLRRALDRILDVPILGRYIADHFYDFVFYALTDDLEGLQRLLIADAACDATTIVRADTAEMPLPPLYTDTSGSCLPADPEGSDSGRYFSDASCATRIAFRPTPYRNYCAEVLSLKPNTRLGNAALWTPDRDQPGDPVLTTPSQAWTLAHGARLKISSESLAGKTVPFMKRVRYRQVTSHPVPNLTRLYWTCTWVSQVDGTCRGGWAAQTQPGFNGVFLGYIKTVAEAGTVPLYWTCTERSPVDGTCRGGWAAQTQPGFGGNLLGYVKSAPDSRTTPLYWTCTERSQVDGTCRGGWAVQTQPGFGGVLLGHVYAPSGVEKGACSLEMRVYKKDASATGLLPMLAFHGGSGQYRGGAFLGFEAQMAHYTDQGFIVFAPFYRLANTKDANPDCNEARWYEITQDAEAALDWVKQNGAALGAQPVNPVVMGQSYGAYLGSWLLTYRSADVVAGLLMYDPSDVRDLVEQARDASGAYADFPVIGIMSGLFDVSEETLRRLDLSQPPDYVSRSSFHHRVTGFTSPVFLMHGLADEVVPSNQSVLYCNAYGGAAVNEVPDGQPRAVYPCGSGGSQLHLFRQGQHGLDACTENDLFAACLAGDEASRQAVVASMQQARSWLRQIAADNLAPTADAGPPQTVNAGARVTLRGTGVDSDGYVTSFRWSQTVGPGVALSDADGATASFVAPRVSADTTLSFRLIVADNHGVTTAATTDVLVKAPVPIPNLMPFYWACNSGNPSSATCPIGSLLGYIKRVAEPNTAPLYWACTSQNPTYGTCLARAVQRTPGFGGPLLGYVKTVAESNSIHLYWACTHRNPTYGTCEGWTLQTTPGVSGIPLGYIYSSTTRPAL